ncbi:glycosyltransferase family 2 protein [Belliella sp. DSM 111904]|uniref:Glycosyltransferase family 2 protein n=1 Tax=Belliella filtrata TaxID=2923435 RepID=A0ABS9UX13_9BACT|nr:glycosyltransferase [Belliella filtrata]MCH7408649.1 glycosyltransferase family 2 protein [Belliella filtrata]
MISIVVCTYNGSNRILPCLESIVNQEGNPVFELIVVDNASNDETNSIVTNYLENYASINWSVIKEIKVGLKYARITGLKSALFDWVLFCDDDNILYNNFISNCTKFLNLDSNLGVLGSYGEPLFNSEKPVWFDKYSSSYALGSQLRSSEDIGNLNYVYGACSIYRKQPLLELLNSGYEPILGGRIGNTLSSGDDVEWCYLMQFLGFTVSFEESLKFYHVLNANRLTWDYYLKLKSGITSSAGVLEVYKLYYERGIRSILSLQLYYFTFSFKSFALYVKHFIISKIAKATSERQLALVILRSRMKSYFFHWRNASKYFNQLIQVFHA